MDRDHQDAFELVERLMKEILHEREPGSEITRGYYIMMDAAIHIQESYEMEQPF